ncbi:hypothetical protein ABEO79_00075 [Micromonospora provocatoris]
MIRINLENDLNETDLPVIQRRLLQIVGRETYLRMVSELGGKNIRILEYQELKQRVALRYKYEEYKEKNPRASDVEISYHLHCSIETVRKLKKANNKIAKFK